MKDNSNFDLFKLETFGAYSVFINFNFYFLIMYSIAIPWDLRLYKVSDQSQTP